MLLNIHLLLIKVILKKNKEKNYFSNKDYCLKSFKKEKKNQSLFHRHRERV